MGTHPIPFFSEPPAGIWRRAARPYDYTISIGETYDFEFTPGEAGEYRPDVQRANGGRLAVVLLRPSP